MQDQSTKRALKVLERSPEIYESTCVESISCAVQTIKRLYALASVCFSLPHHSLAVISFPSLRYPGIANFYGPGVTAGARCLLAESGPEHQPSLYRPLQHNAYRGAQPLPGHSAAGRVAHEPSRGTGFHSPGKQLFIKGFSSTSI